MTIDINAYQACGSRSRLVLFALLVVPLCAWTGRTYSQNLPPKVQAAILRNEIITAVKHNDLTAVVAATDQYRKLGIAMPPALLLVEAQSLHRLAHPVKAFSTLKSFLVSADRKSGEFQVAVQLYPSYQHAANQALAERSLERARTEHQAGHYARALSALHDALKHATPGSAALTQMHALLASYQADLQRSIGSYAARLQSQLENEDRRDAKTDLFNAINDNGTCGGSNAVTCRRDLYGLCSLWVRDGYGTFDAPGNCSNVLRAAP